MSPTCTYDTSLLSLRIPQGKFKRCRLWFCFLVVTRSDFLSSHQASQSMSALLSNLKATCDSQNCPTNPQDFSRFQVAMLCCVLGDRSFPSYTYKLFIITNSNGRLPASGMGAKRPSHLNESFFWRKDFFHRTAQICQWPSVHTPTDGLTAVQCLLPLSHAAPVTHLGLETS